MIIKHKHFDVLIAIAEGRDVEFYNNGEWVTASTNDSATNPLTYSGFEWRVKPVPKEPEYLYVYQQGINYELSRANESSLKFFCGDRMLDFYRIGKIKLESLDE